METIIKTLIDFYPHQHVLVTKDELRDIIRLLNKDYPDIAIRKGGRLDRLTNEDVEKYINAKFETYKKWLSRSDNRLGVWITNYPTPQFETFAPVALGSKGVLLTDI